MPTGLLIGPYARQVLFGKLKFWFAFREDNGSIRRYEATIGKGQSAFTIRNRPYSNFHDYKIPEDLNPYPAAHYPRFPRDKLLSVALTLIVDENDLADLVRLRFGLPITPAEYGKHGDNQCTLNLQP